jgi:hypothetical protein
MCVLEFSETYAAIKGVLVIPHAAVTAETCLVSSIARMLALAFAVSRTRSISVQSAAPKEKPTVVAVAAEGRVRAVLIVLCRLIAVKLGEEMRRLVKVTTQASAMVRLLHVETVVALTYRSDLSSMENKLQGGI